MELEPAEWSEDDIEACAGDWRSRVIAGRQLGGTELPAWAERSYEALRVEVTDDAYPCFFGVQAERRGEMIYTFVSRGETSSLIEAMATFAGLSQIPAYEKYNIAVFFEPDAEPLSHREYHDIFWRTLQSLHDADTHPNAGQQVDPADPAWEFCYQGVEMFVVCACPSFGRRHSRNLGPGMVLLFQPRSVFIDKITNKVIGRRAREQVRKRLKAWDDVGAHPDLGFYGDPGNLEWKQYFLPDDSQPHLGACPFMSRHAKSPQQGSVAHSNDAADAVTSLAEHDGRAADDLQEDGNFPLTPAQEGLWFLWCLDPASAAYNSSSAIELDGPLDVPKLRRALTLLVERHALLRTAFIDIGRAARQCVDADAARAIDWAKYDLRGCEQPMAFAYQLLRDRGNRSFDLGGDGLLRATLLCLAADRQVLQICTHQIVLDAWSLNLLGNELIECYSTLMDGHAPSLPPLPMQFGNYAVQIRARWDAAAQERQLGYWRERLGGASYVLELPLDRPRTAHRKTAAGRLSQVITAELHAAIRRFAMAHDTTPFVAMLGAFALLLQRYSGQKDVRMAVPLLRREPLLDTALIGHFMNVVVIRLQVASSDAFSTLVEQAKRYLAEAQAQGDLPFSRLVDSLRVRRSLANTPLCQVMFNQLPTFRPQVRGKLRMRPFDDGVGRACYDLSMNVAVDRESSSVFLDYSSALLDVSTAQRLLAHYLELLEQVTQPAIGSAVMASLRLSHTGNPAVATA